MKKQFKARSSIISIGLFVALVTACVGIYRISVIQEQLKFNYYWMIVKKARTDMLQHRIEVLEKKLNIQVPKEN